MAKTRFSMEIFKARNRPRSCLLWTLAVPLFLSVIKYLKILEEVL
jgi:hypothetical protein